MGIFSQSSLLGLDIGTHSIKLVEVKHSRQGPVITFAKAVQIPPGQNIPLTRFLSRRKVEETRHR